MSSRASQARREMFSMARWITACSATDAWPYPNTHRSWKSAAFSWLTWRAISSKASGRREVMAKATAICSSVRSWASRG